MSVLLCSYWSLQSRPTGVVRDPLTASSITASAIDEWSQISVRISARQSFTVLFVETCSPSSSILLGSGGLCGLLCSLASPLATLLLSPPPGEGTPQSGGAPGDVCRDVVGVNKLTVRSLCNPASISLCGCRSCSPPAPRQTQIEMGCVIPRPKG